MIGYRFFEVQGFYWRRHHGALVPLSMPHVQPLKGENSSRLVLLRHRAFLARWEEEFDQFASSEWWHVIKTEKEHFEALSKNTRSKVRRGAKLFEATSVQREAVRSEGYAVYRAAYARYATFEAMLSHDGFRQAVENLPSQTEFWAVRERESGQLVAFSENLVRDNACFYSTIWFHPEALKRYAGYLLFHEMNKHYLNERGLKYVSDGARNISHQTNIHEFLQQKFGFRRAYARLKVIYAPGVGFAVRLLYPFRGWFRSRSSAWLSKISVLLEQEQIRRACANSTSSAS